MRIAGFERHKFGGVAVLALLLSGCASSVPQLEDISIAGGQAVEQIKSQKGIAILKVSSTTRCPYGEAVIARQTPKGYIRAARILTIKSFFVHKEVGITSLKPGQYHIVNLNCRSGNYLVSIGRARNEGNLFNRKTYYDKSFASFEVKAGEVTNVGHLQFSPLGGSAAMFGGLDYAVHDLPPKSKQQLQTKHPKIFAKMKTRLMVKGKHEVAPALKKLICDISKTMKHKDAKDKARFDKMCKQQKKS